ncbi:MAG: Uma2 family endonuclease [Deltaproteobacteria bacterium]|nr:Uma2 family endonuclease [Deltaproteobacteria bacterium]
MTARAPTGPIAFAQYVAAERASEIKHQWVDGEVFDMSGGTPEHAALILSVGASLLQQLRGRPCRAFSSDLRIRAGDLVTYPDASVVCGPIERDPEDDSTVVNPTVVVEVLSDSTEAFDRGRKAEHYRKMPSLREYVLVDQHEPHIEVYRRSDQGWVLSEAGKGQKLRLESIECTLEVDAIFEGVLEQPGLR